MKQPSKAWLLLIILNFVIIGCENRETDKVKIRILSTTQPNAEIKISLYNNLDEVVIYESKTDSTGNSSFELTSEKPLFAYIQIGNTYGEVYLSSGYDLLIEEVDQDYQIPLSFSGKGAEINNYISWVNTIVEKIKWANGRSLSHLDYNEFMHRFDSLQTTITNFHNSYVDSIQLTIETISMLEYKNSIKFFAVGQEFKFYKLNNLLDEKWEAKKNDHEYFEAIVSKEFKDITNIIPFDPALLTDGYGDYQMLLNFYWHNNINLPVSEDLLLSKASKDLAPRMTNALIKNGDYPEVIREFLIAFDFKYWLKAYGITPQTDSVFADFQRTYPESSYLPALNKGYNEWLAIAPGKPAPDLEGYTTEGYKVSIKDLIGKVIYIDVWATWCGPCVAEIPASKNLQHEFAGEENIQFLNVSVDRNKSDWEEFLKNDQDWKGLHLIIDPDKIQSLESNYKLYGVPAYILIDHSGNIVNMKAPRPSEEKIESEIRQVLAKVL
jgi:thiol-disulfide isomerase/thioredoxin